MKHSTSMLVPSALVALLLSSLATAAVPLRVPIQGMVRDNAGVPVHSGAFSTTFRLYDAPDAAQPLWMEEHTSVEEEDVVFEQDGARVVVDESSFALLSGATIDFEDEVRVHIGPLPCHGRCPARPLPALQHHPGRAVPVAHSA